MRNVLIICKISTEKNFEKSKKKIFEKIFTNFFSQIISIFFFFKNFWLQIFSALIFFFRKYFIDFFTIPPWGASAASSGVCGRAKRAVGGVGERSEPPAGGLAVGAEGSVNSELRIKIKLCQQKKYFWKDLSKKYQQKGQNSLSLK